MKKTSKKAPTTKKTVVSKAIPQLTNLPFPNAREELALWKAGKSVSSIAKQYGFTRGVSETFTLIVGGKEAYAALRASGCGGRSFGGGAGGKANPRTKEARVADDKAALKMTASPLWTIERIYEPALVRIKGMNGKEEGRMSWRSLKASVHISPKKHRYVECKPAERADLVLRAPLVTVQYSKAAKALRDVEASANTCRKCESPMEWRCSQYGHEQHLACSNFPTCHSTRFVAHSVSPKRLKRLEDVIAKEAQATTYNITRLRKYETSATVKKMKQEAALVERGVKARKVKVQARKTSKAVIAKKAKEVAVDKKRAHKAPKTAKRKVTR